MFVFLHTKVITSLSTSNKANMKISFKTMLCGGILFMNLYFFLCNYLYCSLLLSFKFIFQLVFIMENKNIIYVSYRKVRTNTNLF